MGYNFSNEFAISLSEGLCSLKKQCRSLIWFHIVCQRTSLEFSSIQRVDKTNYYTRSLYINPLN